MFYHQIFLIFDSIKTWQNSKIKALGITTQLEKNFSGPLKKKKYFKKTKKYIITILINIKY